MRPLSTEEQNSGILVYYQLGQLGIGAARATLLLLARLLKQPLFDALRTKQQLGYALHSGTYNLGSGPKESPEHQQTRYKLSECMSCGCCLEACPQYNLEEDESKWDESFIGAHAISQARLFNEHETGKRLKGDRLEELSSKGGVNDCGNAQNCVKVCPKEIPLTESIGAMGRATTIHAINSVVVKMSRLTKVAPLYRGWTGATLPAKFFEADAMGVRGGVEYGFSSTTTERVQAEHYALGKASTLLELEMGMVDRGADISWLSQ